MTIPIKSMKTMALIAFFMVTGLTQSVAMAADSSAFGNALANAYQQLSAVERQQGDERDADAYAARAAAAKAGNPTSPDELGLRGDFLKEHYRSELSEARQRLMKSFDKGGREKAPSPAARAQSSFDCWVEQASEDLQQEHIDACKNAYLLAVADVEKALIPPPPMAKAPLDSDGDGVLDDNDDCPGTPSGTPVDSNGCPEIPNLEGVHFALNKAVLTDSAHTILDHVVSIVENNPHVRIDIVGHTDSSGSDDYNQGLSERRAKAVQSYLTAAGINSDRLSTSGRGESDPTADNSTQSGRKANRRVDLTARPK